MTPAREVPGLAIPEPLGVTRDPQALSDERRYDVPVTVIACEFTTDMLRGAHGRSRRVARITDVELVDLPTGTGRSSPPRALRRSTRR